MGVYDASPNNKPPALTEHAITDFVVDHCLGGANRGSPQARTMTARTCNQRSRTMHVDLRGGAIPDPARNGRGGLHALPGLPKWAGTMNVDFPGAKFGPSETGGGGLGAFSRDSLP